MPKHILSISYDPLLLETRQIMLEQAGKSCQQLASRVSSSIAGPTFVILHARKQGGRVKRVVVMSLSLVYNPGDMVPKRGIYWTHHFHHRLPHPLTIAKAIFPKCLTCKARVRFEQSQIKAAVANIATDPDFVHSR